MVMRVLAIDQARSSGWAVVEPSRVLSYGLARTALERRAAVQRALALEVQIAVLENHARAAYRTSAAHKIAMGAALGWWQQELEVQGFAHTQIRTMHVGDWRGVLFGKRRMDREAAKRECRALARIAFGIESGEDESEAVCIGLAATRDATFQRVARRIEKRSRKFVQRPLEGQISTER